MWQRYFFRISTHISATFIMTFMMTMFVEQGILTPVLILYWNWTFLTGILCQNIFKLKNTISKLKVKLIEFMNLTPQHNHPEKL